MAPNHKVSLKEKVIALIFCAFGVLSVAYGMTKENDVLFIIGLVFIISGYLLIRRGLKKAIQGKSE